MSFIRHTEGYYNFKSTDKIVLKKSKSISDHDFFYSSELFTELISHFQEEQLVLSKLAELGGIEGIAYSLRTDHRTGIFSDEYGNDKNWLNNGKLIREHYFGKNQLTKQGSTPFYKLCLIEFEDFMLRILLGCALISIVVGLIFEEEDSGGWIDGVAILFAIAIVVLVGSVNNYSKEKKFRVMEKESEDQLFTIVLRNNIEKKISFKDVCVGDIIILRAGYTIPCDGLFVFGTDNFTTNEAGLTGESKEIKKNRFHPLLLSGTHISQGDGLMIAIAVGDKTQWGQLMSGLQEKRSETPLQARLDKLGIQIGYGGMIVAFLLFCILISVWIFGHKPLSSINTTYLVETIIEDAILAVTIIVVAVPEGLPLAVTISLAYSMKKMLSDNNFVRHLAACETMGNATTICSDKTGTLTQNIMSVEKVYISNSSDNNNDTLLLDSNFNNLNINNYVLQLIIQSLCINSKAFEEESSTPPKLIGGNQTECALLQWAINLSKINYKEIRNNNPVTKYYPFDSSIKQSSVFLKMRLDNNNPKQDHETKQNETENENNDEKTNENKNHNDDNYVMYTKGAAEQTLNLCNKIILTNGNIVDILNYKSKIENAMNLMTKSGLRCLGLCYHIFKHNELEWRLDNKTLIDNEKSQINNNNTFSNMTWICLIGIKDPIRPEVPNAVKTCQKAGIIIRMVTGDHLETAKHIAKECGILSCHKHICLEGYQFREMTENEKKLKLPWLRVLARSKPQDKENLVKWYMENNEIVAVTGDGANDSLALKEANVGLSMGIQGTDIAKEASDIIIMDDNFASIEKTVMWGRSVYDNIKKFIQFQLTVNVTALTLSLIAAFWEQFQSPLTAVQLLWVNLIMDTMAALALATEKPNKKLLDRTPFKKNTSLISPILLRFIIGHSIIQLIILLITMFQGINLLNINDNDQNKDEQGRNRVLLTVIFNLFVWLQIWNEINARRVNNEINVFDGILANPYFIVIMLITIIAQIFIVELGGDFLRTTGLTWKQWLYCVGMGAVPLPAHQIIRLIPVNEGSGLVQVDVDTIFEKDLDFINNKEDSVEVVLQE